VSTSSVNLSSVLSSINDAFSGKTNGIDVASTVDALMQIEEQPEVQMQQQQADISQQISLLSGISNDLQTLYSAANSLQDVNGGLTGRRRLPAKATSSLPLPIPRLLSATTR
jgi:flagellar capping protein FliD